MPEETRVLATIEGMSIRKRSEESSRCFVMVSFPIQNAEMLLGSLALQVRGNPIGLTFTEIQARLAEAKPAKDGDATAPDAPETEEVDMEVDGKPAKVRRHRSSRNGHAPVDGWAVHRYVESEETPGLCSACHQRPEKNWHQETEADAEGEASLEPTEGDDIDLMPSAAQRLIDDAQAEIDELASVNAQAAADSEAAAAAQLTAMAEGR